MPDTAVGVGFGAFSPIRSVVSHRLQSAVSRRLIAGRLPRQVDRNSVVRETDCPVINDPCRQQ